MRTTHVPHNDCSSRTISRAARIAMLATVLLAGTFAVTVTNGGSAAAQPLQPLNRNCVEVWGVEGVALWLLCPSSYLNDASERERDVQATTDRWPADQQGINRWTYWPGHPGFDGGTSTDIMRWVASPIHEGFTSPDETQ